MRCQSAKSREERDANRCKERTKRTAVIEQKSMTAKKSTPKVVEGTWVPAELLREKILEVPVAVIKVVEKQVEILRIVQEVRCCCAEKCYRVRLGELMSEVDRAKATLNKVKADCVEQCEFLRHQVLTMEKENDELRAHIVQLQETLRDLQLQFTGNRVTEMEVSITEQTPLVNSDCTIKTYDLTTSRNSVRMKSESKPRVSHYANADEYSQEVQLPSHLSSADDGKSIQQILPHRGECTLKEFVEAQKCNESILLLLMLKLTEKVMRSALGTRSYTLYRPDTIKIGFDSSGNLQLILSPVQQLNINTPQDIRYAAPGLCSSKLVSELSSVYNLGAIWKYLLEVLDGAGSCQSIHPLIPHIIASMMAQQEETRPQMAECIRMMKAALTVLTCRAGVSFGSSGTKI